MYIEEKAQLSLEPCQSVPTCAAARFDCSRRKLRVLPTESLSLPLDVIIAPPLVIPRTLIDRPGLSVCYLKYPQVIAAADVGDVPARVRRAEKKNTSLLFP